MHTYLISTSSSGCVPVLVLQFVSLDLKMYIICHAYVPVAMVLPCRGHMEDLYDMCWSIARKRQKYCYCAITNKVYLSVMIQCKACALTCCLLANCCLTCSSASPVMDNCNKLLILNTCDRAKGSRS